MTKPQGLEAWGKCCHENGHENPCLLSTSVVHTFVYVSFLFHLFDFCKDMQLQADKAALEAQMLDLQQNASKGETELKAEKAALAAQVQQLQDTLSLKDIDITGLKTALEAKNADSQTLQEAVEKKVWRECDSVKKSLTGKIFLLAIVTFEEKETSLATEIINLLVKAGVKIKIASDEQSMAITSGTNLSVLGEDEFGFRCLCNRISTHDICEITLFNKDGACVNGNITNITNRFLSVPTAHKVVHYLGNKIP